MVGRNMKLIIKNCPNISLHIVLTQSHIRSTHVAHHNSTTRARYNRRLCTYYLLNPTTDTRSQIEKKLMA
jgi:hypothetical protein